MAAHESREEVGISLGEITQVLRRRIWWFGLPALVGVIAALAVAWFWPARYEAAAIIMIEPQEVPPHLLSSAIVTDTETRFSNIRLRILARDNLSRVMTDLNLFPDWDGPREDAVVEMRDLIRIAPLPPPIVDPRKPITIDSFEIAYNSEDATQAAAVANRLTRDFVAANLQERTAEAESTSEFIDSELSKAKLDFKRVGEELAQYKLENSGELPEDLPVNQSRLDRLTSEHAATLNSLQTSRKQVEKIQAQIDELRINGSNEGYDPVRRKRVLELTLNQSYAQGKTDKHPDVVTAKAEIEKLEVMISGANEIDKPKSPEEAALRRELRNYEVQVGVLTDEKQRLEESITLYEERVLRAPEHATRIETLEASLSNLSAAIRELQRKKVTADMGRRAELAQKGEKFRIVESAEVPLEPISPNRPLFFVVGTVIGLFFGGLLGVIREMVDQSFHSVSELQNMLELPVLGTIPVIELPAEIAKARARMRRLAVVGALILSLVAGGGAAFYFLEDFGSLGLGTSEPTTAPAAKAEGSRV